MKRKRAFTLIEMLVVLALVGLLAALLLPALMRASERSRITRARAEAQTLQQAWLSYWNVYQKWPFPSGVAEMNAIAVDILGGGNPGGENPRKIAFMEFENIHFVEGFKDPWGNLYVIEFDPVETTDMGWTFQTRTHCVNTARYKY